MKISAANLAEVTGGKVHGNGSLTISGVMTDSRSSGAGPEMLFIALRGANHDGHNYIEPLFNRGVHVFLAEKLPDSLRVKTAATFIIVEDTLSALQKMASWQRGLFHGKIIAVTGSAGKTIVKEWLSEMAGTEMNIIRSPRSYNSQVGVPLSLLNVDDRYDMAVIEAGISKPGEMKRLSSMIRPDIVAVTNIGDAHGENFSGRKHIALEKLTLAEHAKILIYNAGDKVIAAEVSARYHDRQSLTWSLTSAPASLRVEASEETSGGTILKCNHAGSDFAVTIPFRDRASVENAVTTIACALAAGISRESIKAAAATLPVVAMRMEVKRGINGCTLIEDYYNSDPGSLTMALDFLRSHARGKTTLILSDFRQIGGGEDKLYGSVAVAIKRAGIDRFIGIGEALCRRKELFMSGSLFCTTTSEFIESFRSFAFHDETILIKGARAYGFERISMLLERQLHQTRLEINMNAVVHNLNQFRSALNPGTGIMAMVKAFAYGSGSAEIASLLEYHHISYFAVAYADEGVALREAGVTTPIMVMNPDVSVMELMIRNDLEPEIYSEESYNSFREAAVRYGVLHYPVHIKIDTGMHRLGFEPDETDRLAEKLRKEERLKVISVFSHLAASEDPLHNDFTHMQAERLVAAAGKLQSALGYKIKIHLLNSAGICRFPEYQFDMVRTGIGLYGIGHYEGLAMRHTGRFITSVSQVRTVRAGDPVSYGCNDASDHDRTIAVVPVGYADGLRRVLGNGRGSLFVAGNKVPITGNVCMDMCMIDVTGMHVRAGDDVEIFGDNLSIEEMAEWCNTIPYEILTSIPARVKRVYINE